MKNRWLRMSLNILLGGIFFFSAATQPVFADSCQFAVGGLSSGQMSIEPGTSVSIRIRQAELGGELINAPDNAAFYIHVSGNNRRYYIPANQVSNGSISLNLTNDSSGSYLFDAGSTHTLQLVRDWGPISNHTVVCSAGVQIAVQEEDKTDMETISDFDYCSQVPGTSTDETTQRGKCTACVERGEPGDFVYTAVGCIRTAGSGLTEDIVRIFMGMIGGVALFSIIAASFLFTTSQGDTNKVKQAKELITAAVSGLFFIIFSIFVLQFIGVNILGIPGLG